MSARIGSIVWLGVVLALGACSNHDDSQRATGLPPDPADWVCEMPRLAAQDIQSWCNEHPNRGQSATLPAAADATDLDAKNTFDVALRDFLRNRAYRALGWVADQSWRLTGPFVGDFGGSGQSFGVHPAVRLWYSPEVVDWLCAGRPDQIAQGAMIVKEMRSIDPTALDIDSNAECMVIRKPADQIEPGSWTVLYRAEQKTFDGWYWANPTGMGDGNPPILDMSAVTSADFFGPAPVVFNPAWLPTGDLFCSQKPADVVTPYNQFGAYCVNCHSSAEKQQTFATMSNILTRGTIYKHFAAPPEAPLPVVDSGAAHTGLEGLDICGAPDWPFTRALADVSPAFTAHYGALGPTSFNDSMALRLPAETFDHVMSAHDGPPQFVTSDQCIGCHDATQSNASNPNMQFTDPQTSTAVNLSPYGEWRASPMGLAGRDPIFFSQLQSETNNLPTLSQCIENTCLHCHGVMGQRQFAIDNPSADPPCTDLFAVAPPAGVPFGQPFALDMVTDFQDGARPAKYGNLARDGISCTVCHHISDQALGNESSFTGNFVAGPPDVIFGPFDTDTVVPKPMQNALGITPQFGAQTKGSDMCGTCHNILLPLINNDGTPHPITAPGGQTITASYEQSTHLEWQNSVFAASGPTFQSCQDCHMPSTYKGIDLNGVKIANIESSDFAPTDNRLPDADITLTPRDGFARHALHGLNLFLNQMFQQFPLHLGVRQIDYMTSSSTQPALITAADSMATMAAGSTAALDVTDLTIQGTQLRATLLVTNKVGHYLPSGVGFRRVFIEFIVADADGNPLFASGRTNELGAILDGVTSDVLATEQGANNTQFQPHYQTITAGNQVQIYEEVTFDSAGVRTTSFLRRVDHRKDNRLRPKGFDPQVFLSSPSPFIRELGDFDGSEGSDPHYTDKTLTGSDEIVYQVDLSSADIARVARVTARLYSQSIPPYYLQQRFGDALVGPANKNHIQRLYYLTSHLNAGSNTPIPNWKLPVAATCKNRDGSGCTQ